MKDNENNDKGEREVSGNTIENVGERLSLGGAIEESCSEFSLLSSSSLPPKSFQSPTPESVILASRQNRQ